MELRQPQRAGAVKAIHIAVELHQDHELDDDDTVARVESYLPYIQLALNNMDLFVSKVRIESTE